MTKDTHTPGPWTISDKKGEMGSRLIYSYDKYGIGEAWDTNNKGENKANARLIAAAPDLLEALEQVLIEYDDVDLADHEPQSFTSAVLFARAAIAKARGQS